MNLFLDTNILVDALTRREPYYQPAAKLLICGAVGEFVLWTSSSQMTDLFYIISEGGKKTLTEQSKHKIKKLREHVNLCALADSEFDRALNSTWQDIEDACVYESAQKIKADYIITRNVKDFEKSSIRTLSATEFFQLLEEEQGLVYEEIPLP